eukprot:2296857-Pyramimonas_sp.AAC.1
MFDMRQQLHEPITYGYGWVMRSNINGELIRKGWRRLTTRQRLVDRLRKRCIRDHQHTVFETETADAGDTAKYPKAMCRKWAATIMKEDSDDFFELHKHIANDH